MGTFGTINDALSRLSAINVDPGHFEADLELVRVQMDMLSREQVQHVVQTLAPRILEQLGTRRYSPPLVKFLARLCAIEGEPLASVAVECAAIFQNILGQALQSQRHFEDNAKDGLASYENALIALHAFVDLQKNYRAQMEASVPPFMDLAVNVLGGFVDYMQSFFDAALNPAAKRAPLPRTGLGEKVALGIKRLKIISELPVVIVLVFQLHRRYINDNVPRCLPLIVKALSFHMSPALGSAEQEVRQFYCEFITCKVKLLSFFAYVSRGFLNAVRVYAAEVPTIVINMLKDCPAEAAIARKELLVAIRHLLSTELRQSFVPFIDILFDEGFLRGDGYTALVVYRPLALSLLADLVHHVRGELQNNHILHVVSVYTRSLHDATLPMAIHSMSAKLLISVLECVGNEGTELSFRRALISKILGSFYAKTSALRKLLGFEGNGKLALDEPLQNPFYEELRKSPLVEEGPRDLVRDAKFLLRTLVSGVKSALLALRSVSVAMGDIHHAAPTGAQPGANPSPRAAQQQGGCGLSMDEGQQLGKFFQDALYCFDLYLAAESGDVSSPSPAVVNPSAASSSSKMSSNMPPEFVAVATSAIPPEEKDLIDQFAYVFTVAEPSVFLDIMGTHLGELLVRMRSNPHLLLIPQFFLAIAGVSRLFTGILISHLMDNLEVVADVQDPVGSFIHMRLFKLIFLALTIYPEEIEPIMQSHISKLITQCLKSNTRSVSVPSFSNAMREANANNGGAINYFMLLRSLFRNIGGGKFESLYKEVHALLANMLEEFNRIAADPHVEQALRDVCVELSLTVPVRLSNLLPYLSLLMKPLIFSLRAEGDLVAQGLRTLELCIDNLTQEFLEPIMSPHLEDLMEALSALLNGNPSASNTIYAVMRILGKFGGRSRRMTRKSLHPLDLRRCSKFESEGFKLTVVPSDPAYFSLADHLQLPLDNTVDALSTILTRKAFGNPEEEEKRALLVQELCLLLAANVTRKRCKAAAENEFIAGSHELLIFKAMLHYLLKRSTSGAYVREKLIPAILASDYKFKLLSTLTEALLESAAAGHDEPARGLWSEVYGRLEDPVNAFYFKFSIETAITLCYESSQQPLDVKSAPARLVDFCFSFPRDYVTAVYTQYGVRLVRALLYILKDPQASELTASEHAAVTSVLYKLLRGIMNNPSSGGSGETGFDPVMSQIIALMVTELSSISSAVRECVQAAFQLISELRGMEIVELLAPYRERLLLPIFAKPLRALPFTTQIGYVDAICFCMSLKPALLSLETDEMLRFLQEVLALAEADDSALLKSNTLKGTMVIESLRIACLRLLSVVLPVTDAGSPPLSATSPPGNPVILPATAALNGAASNGAALNGNGSNSISNAPLIAMKHANLRNHIVSVFFKSLYSRSSNVVNVAQKGLEGVLLQQNKLPKDLLQHGLRPVLLNLAEARRLTPAGLEGLCRVLQLLTTYFKSEIGRKLLDHFAVWADAKTLCEQNMKPPSENTDMKILTAIIQVFHLLPSSASIFVAEIIKKVIDVELTVKRTTSSPFRRPLLLYLVRYPVEAVDYFFENIQLPSVISLFGDLLRRSGSEALAKEISRRLDRMTPALIAHPGPPPAVRSEYLKLLVTLANRHHQFLGGDCSVVLRDLIARLWTSFEEYLRRKDYPLLTLLEEDYAALMTLSMRYLLLRPADVEFCYSWLLVLRPGLPIDLTWVPRFIAREWLPLNNLVELQKIMRSWLAFIGNPEGAVLSKWLCTRLLALPLVSLVRSVGKQEAVYDKGLERMFYENIFKNAAASNNAVQTMAELTVLSVMGESLPADSLTAYLSGKVSQSADITCRVSAQAMLALNNRGNAALLEHVIGQSHADTRFQAKLAVERSLSGMGPVAWLQILSKLLAMDSPTLSGVYLVWSSLLGSWSSVVKHLQTASAVESIITFLLGSLARFGISAAAVPEYREVAFQLMERLVALDSVPGRLLAAALLKCLPAVADASHESAACRRLALSTLKKCHGTLMLDLSVLERLAPENPNASAEDQTVPTFLVQLLGNFPAESVLTCPKCIDLLFYSAVPNTAELLHQLADSSAGISARLHSLAAQVIQGAMQPTPSNPTPVLPSPKLLKMALEMLPPPSVPHVEGEPGSLSSPLPMLLVLLQRLVGREGVGETDALTLLLLDKVSTMLTGENGRSALQSCLQSLWSTTKNAAVFDAIVKIMLQADAGLLASLVPILATSSALNTTAVPASYFDLVLRLYTQGLAEQFQLSGRLEGSFLLGLLESPNAAQFFAFLNDALPTGLYSRLAYGFGGVTWTHVSGKDWLWCLLSFLMHPLLDDSNKVGKIVLDLAKREPQLTRSLWMDAFPQLWARLTPEQQGDMTAEVTALVSKEDLCSAVSKPHPIRTILETFVRCANPPKLPPYLLAKTAQWFGAWHACILLLSREDRDDGQDVLLDLHRKLGLTDQFYGLARRGAQLGESVIALSLGHDSRIPEEQAVLESFQQRALNGQVPYVDAEYSLWEREWAECARRMQQWDLLAEVAKTDDDAFLQLEALWRLGDWSSPEVLQNAHGLVKSIHKQHPHAHGLKLKIYEGILLLGQIGDLADRASIFQTYAEEAWALALREWKALPEPVGPAHLPVLEAFQALIELQEAFSIFANLALPGALHRQAFMQELKGLLGTWRDRLPNRWEDIATWGSLVTWRQFVYSQLNSAFQPLLSEVAMPPQQQQQQQQQPVVPMRPEEQQQSQQQSQQAAGNVHPLAFRGYHEMAWLINRFSNAARKSDLLDLCVSSLNKIYTLPNIEIQDAFLKLREQTKCYLASPGELPLALDVVNATNLNYFNGAQKGDFFALKALIMARLGMLEDANRVFAQAVQIDLNSAKGWSEWARFNDNRFQQASMMASPDLLNFAVNAINCYLQAAALHKSHRARRFLARVLWLLSFEDDAGSLGKSFETYSNDLPVWNWVPFIPQLLAALGRKECRVVRVVLVKIAKCFPQSLYLPLRVANEELKASMPHHPPKLPRQSTTEPPLPPALSEDDSNAMSEKMGEEKMVGEGDGEERMRRSSLEETEDLLAILKTGYPLLALSMENMVDHIVNRLRASPDEDLLRILHTLLMETYQQATAYVSSTLPAEASMANLEAGLRRVSDMMTTYAYLCSKYKAEFDADFLQRPESIWQIMANLRKWNQKLQSNLPGARGEHFPLDSVSRYLSEFEYQKYDDLELPGQSLVTRDNPSENVKLVRWAEKVSIIRRHGTSYRKAYCIGSDGRTHGFLIQNPVARHGRKEERLLQLLRLVRGSLSRKLRTRRRNLQIAVPVIISLSSHARMIQEDGEQQLDSLEDLMIAGGLDQDALVYDYVQKLKQHVHLAAPADPAATAKQGAELLNARVKLVEEMLASSSSSPESLLVDYWARRCATPSDYFLAKQHFCQHYAEQLFVSYVFAVGARTPHKILIQPENGGVVYTYEQLPSFNNAGQMALMEAVPFRLGPAVQKFMGAAGIEGVLAETLLAMAHCFNTGDEGDMGVYLPLYLREELVSLLLSQPAAANSPPSPSQPQPTSSPPPQSQPQQPQQSFAERMDRESAVFRNFSYAHLDSCELLLKIKQNVELVTKRIQTLAGCKTLEKVPDITVPINQNILDLLACATNIQKLALMDPSWHPWI